MTHSSHTLQWTDTRGQLTRRHLAHPRIESLTACGRYVRLEYRAVGEGEVTCRGCRRAQGSLFEAR